MKKQYNNIVYGIDIETSTITIDSDNKCSFMYSFCLCSLDFKTGVYKKICLGRTYEELSDLLYKLNDTDKQTIIYIHNLAYEFSFFSNNVEFFKRHLQLTDYKDCIFQAQNKPLHVLLDKLDFRCSYLLTGKSIKQLGKEINLEKLDFNYNKIRTPQTKLDVLEIEYNFRDVEIMLKSVYRLFKNNNFMTDVSQIPLTKTGIMRFNCEHNPEINKRVEYIEKRTGKKKTRALSRLNNFICHKEKAKNESQLRLWESCFQGGLVYSNPKYCAIPLEGIASYDFSSDYPYQMLYREYPSDFREVKKNKLEEFKRIEKWLDIDNLIYPKISNNTFNAVIEIYDVKKKYDFEPLATSKVINKNQMKNGYNCIVINGKILRCDVPIKLYVTIIDYIMIKEFYDFKLSNVYYLEKAHRYNRTNPFKMECVRYNAKKKIEYKKYNALVESANKFKHYQKNEISDTLFLELINKCGDYNEQLQTSHYLYQAVKSDLNALYGDNAQHLIRTNYLYDVGSRDWISKTDTFEDYEKSRVKTSYIYGMYVPAYARASILYIAHKFISAGYEVLYIDTDSIKVKYNKKCDKIVEEFNKIQLDNLGDDRWTGFGVLEREYIADKFASLGTKSYLKLEDNFLKATISGLPNATGLYNELYDYFGNNFDELVEMVYHYGVCFDDTITHKLTSKYKFNTYDIDIDGYKDTVTSGVILEPCEVTMRDFTSKTWYTYAHIIANYYGRLFSDFCFDVTIMRDKKNKIEVITSG